MTRYGFTGRERDNATGLMYCRARWYDPQQGRFISQDPIGFEGGLNLYGYTANNPVNAVDPSGELIIVPAIIIGAIILIIASQGIGNAPGAGDPTYRNDPLAACVTGGLLGAPLGAGLSLAGRAAGPMMGSLMGKGAGRALGSGGRAAGSGVGEAAGSGSGTAAADAASSAAAKS